jgi:hypothetical protein
MLIEMRVEPPVQLLAGMGEEAIEDALSRLWAKLETMNWDLARAELTPYLPDDVAERFGEGGWDEMRLRVGTAVEAWLTEVRAEAARRPA